MKLTFGYDTTKKHCPFLTQKRTEGAYVAYCIMKRCALWSEGQGECGLKRPEQAVGMVLA